MTPVAPDQVVHTTSPTVKKAQEGVLEFLLINHPLDCPVCDKGGECPLQDQTFSHGPGESRFIEEKRHFEKPIPISELVYLDRERCILCDRCTRFAADVAGDPLIHFTSRGNKTQVHDVPGPPVRVVLQRQHGADLPGRRAHRQALPLQGPAVGPRPDREHLHDVLGRLPHHRAVEPQPAAALPGRRQRPGQLGLAVRQGPLRLRGREQRPSACARRWSARATTWCRASWSCAPRRRRRPDQRRARPTAVPASVAVIGGARGTNEDAYAWAKLAKGVIGTDQRRRPARRRARPGGPAALPRPRSTRPPRRPTVVLLGPDLKEELPVLYLRLRDAAEKRRTRLVELAREATGLTPYAWKRSVHRPRAGRLARPVVGGGSRRHRRRPAPTVGRAAGPRARSSSWSAGPTWPSRGVRRRTRWPRCARPLPGATFLSALRRGNVHGALDLGSRRAAAGRRAPGRGAGRALRAAGRSRPTSRASTRPASSGRGRRPHRLPGAARRRPARRLPRPRPSPSGPSPARHGHRRRHLPDRVVPAGRRRARRPPASPRSRAPRPTSRVGSAR